MPFVDEVEGVLVLCVLTRGQHGSYHQPGVAAGGCAPSHQTCRPDGALANHDARFPDRHGWQCQFLEADLKTPLPAKGI